MWTGLAVGLVVKQVGTEPRFQPSHPRAWRARRCTEGGFRYQ